MSEHEHGPLCELACQVAAKVAGVSVETVYQAVQKVDEGGFDEISLDVLAMLDISSLVDMILQLFEAWQKIFDGCNESRKVRFLMKPTRRLRNKLEYESRDFCEGCQAARFGKWVDKGGEIAATVLDVCGAVEKDKVLSAVRDADKPDYLVI